MNIKVDVTCTKCGSKDYRWIYQVEGEVEFVCNSCGNYEEFELGEKILPLEREQDWNDRLDEYEE